MKQKNIYITLEANGYPREVFMSFPDIEWDNYIASILLAIITGPPNIDEFCVISDFKHLSYVKRDYIKNIDKNRYKLFYDEWKLSEEGSSRKIILSLFME